MKWPWRHLYENPIQIGRIAVARHFRGEDWVFFERIDQPENLSLQEIQRRIDNAKTAPIRDIFLFQLQWLFCHLPVLIRHAIWRFTLNASGTLRTQATGTFGLTTVAARGAISIHPPSLGNMTMTYSPINEDGDVRITFVYDHRMLDGSVVAGYLAEFEETLNGQICDELEELCETGEREHTLRIAA